MADTYLKSTPEPAIAASPVNQNNSSGKLRGKESAANGSGRTGAKHSVWLMQSSSARPFVSWYHTGNFPKARLYGPGSTAFSPAWDVPTDPKSTSAAIIARRIVLNLIVPPPLGPASVPA